jgi:hypothetical protein
MTRRRGLIGSAIATLILFLAMSPAEERMTDTGGPGREWRRRATIGRVVAWFGALGAAFDALENVCLLLTLDDAGNAFPLLATIFAGCKFILLATAIAYLLAGLATWLHSRRPTPRTS